MNDDKLIALTVSVLTRLDSFSRLTTDFLADIQKDKDALEVELRSRKIKKKVGA